MLTFLSCSDLIIHAGSKKIQREALGRKEIKYIMRGYCIEYERRLRLNSLIASIEKEQLTCDFCNSNATNDEKTLESNEPKCDTNYTKLSKRDESCHNLGCEHDATKKELLFQVNQIKKYISEQVLIFKQKKIPECIIDEVLSDYISGFY